MISGVLVPSASVSFFPFNAILIVVATISVQATMIAAAAAVVVKMCKRDAAWMHRIWMSAVMLLLVILPLQIGSLVWMVSIPVARGPAEIEDSANAGETKVLADRIITTGIEASLPNRKNIDVAHSNSQLLTTSTNDTLLNDTPISDALVSDAPMANAEFPQPEEIAGSRTRTYQKRLGNFLQAWPKWLAILYTMGVIIAIARLLLGVRFLESLRTSGSPVGPDLAILIDRLAAELKLKSRPQARLVQGLEMPLVYGLTSGVLLVPDGFEAWPSNQQKAVLMHELMHIKRRDIASELLSRVMRAFYWLHPAAWYVSRQVTVTRELATDQIVVLTSLERIRYATGLMEVLERLSDGAHGQQQRPPVVAMAGFSGIEQRVKWILETSPVKLPGTRGGLLVFLLAVIATATTVQFRWKQVDGAEQENATQTTDQPNDFEAVLPTDNDFFGRLKASHVAEVSDTDYEAEFTVSGRVLSTEGSPVAEAIVVLRESSRATLSWDSKYRRRRTYERSRTNDVFAKATTDAEGRFEIRSAKAPAVPAQWGNGWEGDIVASHPELGVGWATLSRDNEIVRVLRNVTIHLKGNATLEGRYLTPNGEPLANHMVQVSNLDSGTGGFENRTSFDLQASQLTLRALTDDEGRFRFKGLPPGFIASVGSTSDGEWLAKYVAVATSTDVTLGEPNEEMNQMRTWARGKTVVGNPFVILADPGIRFRGVVVDDKRQPVPDAEVWLGSSIFTEKTNEAGEFEFHASTTSVERQQGMASRPTTLLVRPKAPDLLMKSLSLTPDELKAGGKIMVELSRGYKVSGKVVSATGGPCEGVSVNIDPQFRLPTSVLTDSLGNYEVYLPPGTYAITYAADVPGYRLPTSLALRRGDTIADPKSPKRDIEVIAGNELQVETVTVETLPQRNVLVVFPDGTRVERASVALADPSNLRRGTMQVMMTDGEGLTTVTPSGDEAKLVLEASFSTAEKSYSGRVRLEDVDETTEPIRIELREDWLVRGRLMLNGQPVEGAKIDVGESELVESKMPNGQIRRMQTTSSFREATSDANGIYEVRVRAGRQYFITLKSVPGVERKPTDFTILPEPTRVSEGIYEVRDYDIKLGKTEISGRVVDLGGRAIGGATVQVRRTADVTPETWKDHRKASQMTTDNDGRFTLRNVPEGNYDLEIRLDRRPNSIAYLVTAEAGASNLTFKIDNRPQPAIPRLEVSRVIALPAEHSTSETQVDQVAAPTLNKPKSAVDASSEDADASLPNQDEVTGLVVDGAGRPVVGASVHCRLHSGYRKDGFIFFGAEPTAIQNKKTDSQGQFVVHTDHDVVRINFAFAAPGFGEQQVSWMRGSSVSLNVELSRGASINGRLVGPDDRPVSNATLGIVQTNGAFPPKQTITDNEGRFQFDDLQAEKQYSICTGLDQVISGVLPVSVVNAPEAGKRADLGDVRAEIPKRLTVTVQTLDDSPLPVDTTVIVNRNLAWRSERALVATDGKSSAQISLSAVGEEILEISVLAKGYKVIRTLPDLARDLKDRYRLRFPESSQLTIILVPE